MGETEAAVRFVRGRGRILCVECGHFTWARNDLPREDWKCAWCGARYDSFEGFDARLEENDE